MKLIVQEEKMGFFTPHYGCRRATVQFEQLSPGLYSTSLRGPQRLVVAMRGGTWVGRKRDESRRPLQGQFCYYFPPCWGRKFLAWGGAGMKDGCGATRSLTFSLRGQQTFSVKGQDVKVLGFGPTWCLSQLLSSIGLA